MPSVSQLFVPSYLSEGPRELQHHAGLLSSLCTMLHFLNTRATDEGCHPDVAERLTLMCVQLRHALQGGYVGGTHVPVPASPQVNGCTPFRSPMPQYGSPSPWNTGSRVGCGTHTPLSAGGPFGRLGF